MKNARDLLIEELKEVIRKNGEDVQWIADYILYRDEKIVEPLVQLKINLVKEDSFFVSHMEEAIDQTLTNAGVDL